MAYISGFHAIEECIRAGRTKGPLFVAKAPPRAQAVIELAREKNIPVERSGTAALDRLVKEHRGLVLEIDSCGVRERALEEYLALLDDKENALAVILDEITDPHNYGAILRSCDQFGADLVITRTARVAKHADAVAKASAGAVSWAPVCRVPNLPRAVEALKEAEFWVYGADMAGESLFSAKLRGRVALILGGEGAGLTRLLRENCDALLAIPSQGRVDSLNVSVAAGIFLYEATRQRAGEITPAAHTRP